MKLPQSTRLRFSVIIIAINLILGVATLLIAPEVLVAMGTFLLMSNSPLYAYILGDTFRPSEYPPSNDNNGGGGGSWWNRNGNNNKQGDQRLEKD